MGSHTDVEVCPICGGNDMLAIVEDYYMTSSSGSCSMCGFMYFTKTEQMSFEEVNELTNQYNVNHNEEMKSGEMEERKNIILEEYNKWGRKITDIFGNN